MVEYLNGDISTPWGAKRATNGHPAPFHVKYIEIGNEEAMNNGDSADDYLHYIECFNDLYTAMKAKDPNLKFINASWWRPESPNMKQVFDALNGKADYWDFHPWTDNLSAGKTVETELQQMQNLFNQWDMNTTMKCAIFEENGNTHNLQRAIAHASVLNAVRRMSDFVLTSCVANALQPYQQNDNGWDQGQIFFTPAQVWRQPTFYAQQMAAANHLPYRVKQTSIDSTLDITATSDKNRQTLVIHVVNTNPNVVNQAFALENFNAAETAQLVVLQGNLKDENTPDQPEKIVPQLSEIILNGRDFSLNFPPHSYTILKFFKK
jgi:alpha-L-arabinofuranosidase